MRFRSIVNVLIIGAGNIGSRLDRPGSNNILTHAHAFSSHQGFCLKGFVDKDRGRAARAAKKWGAQAFRSIEEAFNAHTIDVAVIAVPDDCHYEIFRQVANFAVSVVFIEKPIATSVGDARDMISIARKKKIGIIVNYTRRFLPEIQKAHNEIVSGRYGAYTGGCAYYGKGILHSGSHVINLARYLLGDLRCERAIDRLDDFDVNDPTVSAILRTTRNTPFYLGITDSRRYTFFDMDLFFEKGRLRLSELGRRLERYAVRKSAIFNGYRNLSKISGLDTFLQNGPIFAADNVHRHLTKNTPLACGPEEAYQTLRLCLEIKRGVR